MRARRLTNLVVITAALALPQTAAGGVSANESFPANFQWGVAGAGFQTEMGGGSTYSDKGTDWWAWVHDPANIAAGKVSGDLPEKGPGGWKTYFASDIANAKSLGMKSWRMGIEWSRIFPHSTASVHIGATVTDADLVRLDRLANKSALARYRRIITSARTAGMNPFVTLNHFALPLWIHDPIAVRNALDGRNPDDPVPASISKGGWLSAKTVTEFRKYAAYLAWKLGDIVDWWAPINEPLVVAVNGYVNVPGAYAGWFPPGGYSYRSASTAINNMVAANAAAYDELHSHDTIDSDNDGKAAQSGLVNNMIHFVASDPSNATDVSATTHADEIFNRIFPNAAINGVFDRNANGKVDSGESDPSQGNKADFMGVNYYFRGRVSGIGIPLSRAIPLLDFVPHTTYRWVLNPLGEACPSVCSEFGSEIDADGFGAVLREAAQYGKPLIVTENGMADSTDSQRPGFLVRHLDQVARVAAEKPLGVPLIGFYEWSLTDNYEWSAGYRPKFGLYSFSASTLRRTARGSAATFGQIAKANSIPGNLLDRWVNSSPSS
jgi:beta-glucosidase/6-phospho-beta-glucosidase/beta-galactosidase